MSRGPGPVLKFCKFNTENNITKWKQLFSLPIFKWSPLTNKRHIWGVQYGTVKGKRQKKNRMKWQNV